VLHQVGVSFDFNSRIFIKNTKALESFEVEKEEEKRRRKRRSRRK